MSARNALLSAVKPGRRFVISVPLVWLLVFFALPFLILLRISVTDMGGGIDPFAPLLDTSAGSWQWRLKWENYSSIFKNVDSSGKFGDTIYMAAYWTSLRYALLTTLLCLFIG